MGTNVRKIIAFVSVSLISTAAFGECAVGEKCSPKFRDGWLGCPELSTLGKLIIATMQEDTKGAGAIAEKLGCRVVRQHGFATDEKEVEGIRLVRVRPKGEADEYWAMDVLFR